MKPVKSRYSLIEHPLDPSVRIVARRFAFRLAILILFCLVPTDLGFRRMFIVLAGINAIFCLAWALLRREKIRSAGLTHWDEALVMFGLFLAAHLA